MTDGWWRIKQHAPNAPNGFTVTEITIATRNYTSGAGIPSQADEPEAFRAQHGLVFTYADSHQEIFPWASIVHAEYQPPTQER